MSIDLNHATHIVRKQLSSVYINDDLITFFQMGKRKILNLLIFESRSNEVDFFQLLIQLTIKAMSHRNRKKHFKQKELTKLIKSFHEHEQLQKVNFIQQFRSNYEIIKESALDEIKKAQYKVNSIEEVFNTQKELIENQQKEIDQINYEKQQLKKENDLLLTEKDLYEEEIIKLKKINSEILSSNSSYIEQQAEKDETLKVIYETLENKNKIIQDMTIECQENFKQIECLKQDKQAQLSEILQIQQDNSDNQKKLKQLKQLQDKLSIEKRKVTQADSETRRYKQQVDQLLKDLSEEKLKQTKDQRKEIGGFKRSNDQTLVQNGVSVKLQEDLTFYKVCVFTAICTCKCKYDGKNYIEWLHKINETFDDIGNWVTNKVAANIKSRNLLVSTDNLLKSGFDFEHLNRYCKLCCSNYKPGGHICKN